MALDTFNPYLFVSAGEQSNKFLTPTYTGGVAKFQAQRAQELAGLTVRIDPIQEGAGDPSPDNIRPISGRTGLTLMTDGKNLIDDSKKVSNSALTAITIGQTAGYGTPSIFLKAGTYTFSVEFAEGVGGAGYVKVGSASGTRIWQTGQTQGTITLTDDSICSFYVYNSETPFTSVSDVIHAQVEAGESASKYTPYTGAAYPVTWETEAGTVYGGTLDVVSGVLTVDKLYAEFAEDKYTLTYNSVYTSVYGYGNSELGELIKPNASTEVTEAICNMLPSIARNVASSTPGIFQYHGQNNQVRLTFPRESDYDSPSKIYALGVTAVIPLKEPLAVYQLTPEDVKTLTGFNQIYSDAGPVIDIQF